MLEDISPVAGGDSGNGIREKSTAEGERSEYFLERHPFSGTIPARLQHYHHYIKPTESVNTLKKFQIFLY